VPEDEYQGRERKRGVTLHWLNARLLVVVTAISLITSLVVCVVALLVVQSQANQSLRNNSVNGCDGTNLLRGVARILTHGGEPLPPDPANLADFHLRIRDCGGTYDTGRIVVLEPDQEFEFLKLLASGRRVAVRDGGDRFEPIP
jgi:hypothetical protein